MTLMILIVVVSSGGTCGTHMVSRSLAITGRGQILSSTISLVVVTPMDGAGLVGAIT